MDCLASTETANHKPYNHMTRKTNIERVTEFMEFGSPLNQVFVMEALRSYSEKVIAQQNELRTKMKNGFVEPEAWIQCASQWQKHLENNICLLSSHLNRVT